MEEGFLLGLTVAVIAVTITKPTKADIHNLVAVSSLVNHQDFYGFRKFLCESNELNMVANSFIRTKYLRTSLGRLPAYHCCRRE